jgi:hypothetical protein
MELSKMNFGENPITDLHDAIAHAQYQGFSDIHYENRDWTAWRDSNGKEDKRIAAQRRPTTRDFGVYAMFTQTWGSTALGHGGMGGSAMTAAYTIVLECVHTNEFLVYFGGVYCYTVSRKSKNLDKFIEDCSNRCLKSKRNSGEYHGD